MRGLLIRDCPPTPSETSPPPQSGETAPAAPSEPTPGNSSSQTITPPPETTPLKVDEELMTELPSIPQVQSMKTTRDGSVLAYAPYIFPTATGPTQAEVLGVSNRVPLQASSEGWRFWGVAWYWWAIAVLVGLGVWMVMKRFVAERTS